MGFNSGFKGLICYAFSSSYYFLNFYWDHTSILNPAFISFKAVGNLSMRQHLCLMICHFVQFVM